MLSDTSGISINNAMDSHIVMPMAPHTYNGVFDWKHVVNPVQLCGNDRPLNGFPYTATAL